MLALYRKYRPKTFDDVLGQTQTITILKNTTAQNKFAHAYLFYGPRGTGKTTTARILAKAANCTKHQEDKTFAKKGEPCNKCLLCTSIDEGRSLDVVEIDAASNRGIDEIRDLKENIKTLPSSARFKVFIIDEVHMLTPQAFNALLKTLEEPPAHAIFILATTEYEKVPATIVSRTQRFHFKRLTLKEIVAKLETICKAEKITYEKEALELIASLADGSVRDAESLLDQMATMKEGAIATADVETMLGKIGSQKTIQLADALLKNDLKNALKLFHEIYTQGHNLFQLNKDLTEYLRRTLSLRLNPDLETLFAQDIASSEIISLKNHAAILNEQKTIALIKALINAYTNMRYNPFPSIPFEIAIIESLKK